MGFGGDIKTGGIGEALLGMDCGIGEVFDGGIGILGFVTFARLESMRLGGAGSGLSWTTSAEGAGVFASAASAEDAGAFAVALMALRASASRYL